MLAVEVAVRRRRAVLAAVVHDTTGLEVMRASTEESTIAENEREAWAPLEFEQREYPIDLLVGSLLCGVSAVLAAPVPVRAGVDWLPVGHWACSASISDVR